jgi:hypothetical protein
LKVLSASQLNQVIFKDKASAPVGKKFTSLFPGLGYAAGYKVGEAYMFLGELIAEDILGLTTNLQVWWATVCS